MTKVYICSKCGKKMVSGYVIDEDRNIYCYNCAKPYLERKRLTAKYGRLVFIEMVGNGLTLDDAIAKYHDEITANNLDENDVKEYASYLYSKYA